MAIHTQPENDQLFQAQPENSHMTYERMIQVNVNDVRRSALEASSIHHTVGGCEPKLIVPASGWAMKPPQYVDPSAGCGLLFSAVCHQHLAVKTLR